MAVSISPVTNSLEELPRRLQHMSREEYQTLCQGAREMGARLRRGAMLGRVLRAHRIELIKPEIVYQLPEGCA